MSTDKENKPYTRDNDRPLNVYSAPVEPRDQPERTHSMLLPTTPFTVSTTPFTVPTTPFTGPQNQQYTRQFQHPQQQQQLEQFMYNQLRQFLPQSQHLMSGQLSQTSLQHMSRQLSQISLQHMSRQLGQTSPPQMSSQQAQTSSQSQHLMSGQLSQTSFQHMSSQLGQTSPQHMSSQLGQTSPQHMSSQQAQTSSQSQHLMSGQLNQTSLQDQLIISNQFVQTSPQDHQLSSQLGQTSPQHMSSQQVQTSPPPQYLMSNQLAQSSSQIQHLMPSQLNQTSPHVQQLPYSQVAQSALQLYPRSINLQDIRQNVQNITVDLDSASFAYDQLAMDDSGSAPLRPDILATSKSLIEQRELDLNISSVTGNTSSNRDQNVFLTSASKTFDALIPEQESTNLILETLLTTANSSFPRNVVTPPAIISTSVGNDSFFQSLPSSCHDMPSTSQFYNLPVLSSGVALPGKRVNSTIQMGQLPVKQECEVVNVPATETTHISSPSLWGNQENNHFFRDRFRTFTESFLESSSSAATVPLVNANMGNTPVITQETRAPKRSFGQSSLGPAARRTVSECSTSSGSVSLDDNESASPNTETSDNGNATEAGDRDPSYLEKRRKNNESAKKSRDARRMKEESTKETVYELQQKYYLTKTHRDYLIERNARLRHDLQTFEAQWEQLQGEY